MTDLTRAHRIRIRIAVKGLKKKDVAEKVGVTASWLSRVLNERVTMSLPSACAGVRQSACWGA